MVLGYSLLFMAYVYVWHIHDVNPLEDRRTPVLNRQTFKALSACELINVTSLVGRFYGEVP